MGLVLRTVDERTRQQDFMRKKVHHCRREDDQVIVFVVIQGEIERQGPSWLNSVPKFVCEDMLRGQAGVANDRQISRLPVDYAAWGKQIQIAVVAAGNADGA